ncbi:hypothetical protein G6O67_001939 [Ophiocordyceps sinensis]|uniref:Uncharacterized protein n=1 Tax=Ophiocordyceps sinensis TaxID=72228 RepID=A0A8H4PT46_9HYPO|nr:hypothetical protein G6O67_001939 [Ophiocordyceps sinensis]
MAKTVRESSHEDDCRSLDPPRSKRSTYEVDSALSLPNDRLISRGHGTLQIRQPILTHQYWQFPEQHCLSSQCSLCEPASIGTRTPEATQDGGRQARACSFSEAGSGSAFGAARARAANKEQAK